MPFAYLLECSDRSFYAGSTWDLELRVWQHAESEDDGAAYTRKRRPVRLVWAHEFETMIEAFAWEQRLKGWSRAKKEALIRGDFDALPGLSSRAWRHRGRGVP